MAIEMLEPVFMARYSQNQDQFFKEKNEVTIWVTNLQFWVIHD